MVTVENVAVEPRQMWRASCVCGWGTTVSTQEFADEMARIHADRCGGDLSGGERRDA